MRAEFNREVFKRDNSQCVVCKKPATDAHHLIERRLWPCGGYILDNGVSLCAEHHIEAEMTLLSVEQLRELAGITKKVLPPQMYPDVIYDKWGNVFSADTTRRYPGPLFYDESVQKILEKGGKLGEFTQYVKYPRTYHLPWSEGVSSDDRVIANPSRFLTNTEIVVTEKMDGENTTMYNDYIHARSVDGRAGPGQDYVRALHGLIGYQIPEGWRICGENLHVKHAISYSSLSEFFMIFSVWERMNCMSWDDTQTIAEMLELPTVPVLFRGTIDSLESVHKIWEAQRTRHNSEGYVVRPAAAFEYKDFAYRVAKFVRGGHVQATQHWLKGPIQYNVKRRD